MKETDVDTPKNLCTLKCSFCHVKVTFGNYAEKFSTKSRKTVAKTPKC